MTVATSLQGRRPSSSSSSSHTSSAPLAWFYPPFTVPVSSYRIQYRYRISEWIAFSPSTFTTQTQIFGEWDLGDGALSCVALQNYCEADYGSPVAALEYAVDGDRPQVYSSVSSSTPVHHHDHRRRYIHTLSHTHSHTTTCLRMTNRHTTATNLPSRIPLLRSSSHRVLSH